MYTSSNPGNTYSIVLHPSIVLAFLSLSLPVTGISWYIHSTPVLYSSSTFGVQVATIVVRFVDNNFNVDNKGKDYQQF